MVAVKTQGDSAPMIPWPCYLSGWSLRGLAIRDEAEFTFGKACSMVEGAAVKSEDGRSGEI